MSFSALPLTGPANVTKMKESGPEGESETCSYGLQQGVLPEQAAETTINLLHIHSSSML